MKNTYKLTEGAVLLAVFAVLLLVTLYIPVIGLIINLFLALPFLLFGAKYDWKSTAVFTIAAILLSMILGSFLAIPLAIAYGSTGAVMGYLIKGEKSRLAVFVAGSIIFLINLVIQYAVSVAFFNLNFIQEMMDVFRDSIDQSIKMLEALGQSTDEKMIKQFEDMIDLLETLVPSMFVMSSFIVVFLIQVVSFPILKRFGVKISKWKPFRELNIPKSILWYYLITMLATILMKPEEGTYWFWALANLSYIFQILLVIQGLSFVFYISHMKNYPKAFPIIVVVFMFLVPLVLPIIRILGIIDLGFDLRKRLYEK